MAVGFQRNNLIRESRAPSSNSLVRYTRWSLKMIFTGVCHSCRTSWLSIEHGKTPLLMRMRAKLSRLGSDDLVYTHASSVVEDKAGFIDHIVNGKMRFIKVDYEDVEIRPHGDMALLTCALHLKTVDRTNGERGELHFRTTHVWILEDGRWQLLANQSTYLSRQ